MGVIIRQSIKQSIVLFTGLIVAGCAQLFVYTLDESVTYGAAQRILAISLLVAPLLLFGVPQALIKFYEKYRESGGGYLANFLLLVFALYGIFIGLFLCFKDGVYRVCDHLGFETSLIDDSGIQIAILIIVHMVFSLLSNNMANHKRIVWPGIFDGLWTKVALAILVYLIIEGYLTIETLSWGVVAYYSIALFSLIIYSQYLGKLNLQYNPKVFEGDGFKNISRYAAYTGLTVFGATFVTRVDGFMVAVFTTDQLTGVYSLFLFLAAVVHLPARAVGQISAPIIAQANERSDFLEVKKIYAKSANTLFLVGITLFALIYLSIDDLFVMTGKESFYQEYFILFVVLGLSKIVTATLTSAVQILVYSKYYRYTLYITIGVGVANVLLNYYFLTTVFVDEPLTGVCLATFISTICQYFLLMMFVYIKFGIHPFQRKMLVALCIVLTCFGMAYYLPLTSIALIDIILKSIIFIIPFSYLIYTFEISDDVNSLMDQTILRIKNRDFKNLI